MPAQPTLPGQAIEDVALVDAVAAKVRAAYVAGGLTTLLAVGQIVLDAMFGGDIANFKAVGTWTSTPPFVPSLNARTSAFQPAVRGTAWRCTMTSACSVRTTPARSRPVTDGCSFTFAIWMRARRSRGEPSTKV